MNEFGVSIKPPVGISLDFDLTNLSSENIDQMNDNMGTQKINWQKLI